MKDLNISEIFYSLQGEGLRAGSPTIFIRLQGCSAKNKCFALGIKCDTEFESGQPYSMEYIENWITENANGCKEITWSGGEPLDQLTSEHTKHFKDLGFYQTIETSGLRKPCEYIDFISVSPKVAEHIVARNFTHVQELRYVRHSGQSIPMPSITADKYYISPHSDGFTLNTDNINHCIELCKQSPKWSLSVQMHKLWVVL